MLQSHNVIKTVKNYITAENVVPIRSFSIISSQILAVVSVTNIISHTRKYTDILVYH